MRLQVQVLGFHIYPLSHTGLLTKSSLHSHLQVFLFHSCLSLQIALVKQHIHLHVSCQTIFLVPLILANKLKTLIFMSLKLVSAVFYEIFIFSSNDSSSKTKKNVFYFI